MLQPIDNPQPLTIPARVSPKVVASSRQLIPLGTVEMGGKSYYRFELGSGFFSAIKFYEVDVIRSINQMTENEVMFGHIANAFSEEEQEDLEAIATEIEQRPMLPLTPTAEPEQTPAPVVESEVESEPGAGFNPGAKIVRWYADTTSSKIQAEEQIAALEAKGWIFRGIAGCGREYSVLYVKPQAAVQS